MITQNTIQNVLSRLDIVEVIGSFVKLKKRGANYLGNCPFHNERTPSFTVSPSKEIFKCFGCGKSGNTVSFLMEHEKLSYAEALRWLAARYNVEVEETETSPEQKQQQQTAESLHIINAFAQKFYAKQLFETEEGKTNGLGYLEERGFTKEIIQKFGIGYAPDKREAFTSEALAAQYNKELLQKAGLVAERNGQLQDNYRDRIVFPVHNNSGKVIGFGARLIKKNDKAPKYINTPENELYVKSKILYGTYFARQAIDKADECFLVEGYTDVVSLHQAGIENVVASGGTSLTQDQLRLIKKFTSNLTIIYDGDAAGVKAALRGLDMALEESLNVKLVLVPDGEDPDSHVKKVGAQRFKQFVAENKKDFILFQLDVLLKDAGNDAGKKSEVVNQVAETIAKVDKTEDFTKQQNYIRQCSDVLKISEEGLLALVNKYIRGKFALKEKKDPVLEEKWISENAMKGEISDYNDQSFELIFKEELQEKEVARVLIEHGSKNYDDSHTVAQYILSEAPEHVLIDNKGVLKVLEIYQKKISSNDYPDKTYFIYHSDLDVSTLAVSVLQIKYQESSRHTKQTTSSRTYTADLTKQSYTGFMYTVKNPEELSKFLNISRDRSHEEAHSAVLYLNLKKVMQLISESSVEFEKENFTEAQLKNRETHERTKANILMKIRLKEEQRKIINGNGTVYFRPWKN